MRGRAHNRAQRQRAKARAHHLIANVLLLRGDNPANRWEVPVQEAARLERSYAVDRAPHAPNAHRGEHRQERQAAADEREWRSCLDCDNIYRGDLECPACGNHSGEPLNG